MMDSKQSATNDESQPQQDEQSECPACGSSEVAELTEIPDPICEDCGFVLADDATIPSDYTGGETNEQTSVDWSEFRSVSDSTEKQVASALEYSEELGEKLGLSVEAQEEAAEIYAEAAIEEVTNGRSVSAIVAAAICLAARRVNKPRPSDRVAEASKTNSKRLKQVLRLLQQSLGYEPSVNDPREYVPFLCYELDLSTTIETETRQLLEKLDNSFRQNGKNPVGIAAAALYITANEKVTQRQIADIAGITQETIRVRLHEIRETREAN